jgi:hypothetical protein
VGGFWSPDALTSSPVRRPCASCPGGEIGFHWNNYVDDTAHVGGPIKRDGLWFFGGLIYRGRYGTPPGQPLPPPEERFLDWLLDTNHKLTWKIDDRLQFQQTYYGEVWRTLNPNFTSPTRPIATLQRSEASLGDDPNFGSQLMWTITPTTVLTARYGLSKGTARRIGFFRDLTTPNHTDSVTGFQSGNTQAHRFWPRRDEVSVKLNSYVAGRRFSHNLAYGMQLSRNKDLFVSIEPGGVIYNDANGRPDQATFIGPDARGGVSRAQGVWAEDEVTMRRLTVKVGARFDRMEGISPDVPQFDGEFNETGLMLEGLGHILTWNQVSPRVGANVRLTDDGKTVLHGVAGRYYLPLFISEFENLDPSRASITLARYNPASCGTTLASCYSPIAVTTPFAQVRFDPNTKAPYTDQFSIGVDREIGGSLAVGVNLVHKNNGNPLGWVEAGGVYGTQDVRITGQAIDGRTVDQTLTLFPLLSSPSSRLFLKTNPPAFYNRYNALILTLTRRLANGWQLMAGYTRQRSLGIDPPASFTTVGLDPNSLINLAGGLGVRDRPNMVTFMGSYEVPRLGVQLSGNLDAVSGAAVSSLALVSLPQGRLAVNLEAPGSRYRTPQETYLHMRITKFLLRGGSHRLELTGELKNALQETGSPDIQSLVFNSPTFLQANTYPEPRQLRLFARWFF